MMNKENEAGIAFKAETGELYMLGKKERILLRAILSVTLKTSAGREIIAQKFGRKSLETAKRLLEEMEGVLDAS